MGTTSYKKAHMSGAITIPVSEIQKIISKESHSL